MVIPAEDKTTTTSAEKSDTLDMNYYRIEKLNQHPKSGF